MEYLNTPIRIRKDIKEFSTKYCYRKRNSVKTLIAEALNKISLENAVFGFCNEELDKQVKREIKLYFETWVTPLLCEAFDKSK